MIIEIMQNSKIHLTGQGWSAVMLLVQFQSFTKELVS